MIVKFDDRELQRLMDAIAFARTRLVAIPDRTCLALARGLIDAQMSRAEVAQGAADQMPGCLVPMEVLSPGALVRMLEEYVDTHAKSDAWSVLATRIKDQLRSDASIGLFSRDHLYHIVDEHTKLAATAEAGARFGNADEHRLTAALARRLIEVTQPPTSIPGEK